jgi:hypothetical protein
VYIDESGIDEYMYREKGRAVKGRKNRAVAEVANCPKV